MKTAPVSVVMPTYNAESTVDEAVCSILNQTWENLEFIIVDDGSSDNTVAKLEPYENLDRRVRVCREEKKGLVAALNLGCRRARGKYIARMDADDISLPSRIERQVEFLNEHPEIGIAGTWAIRMNENGLTTSEWRLATNPQVLRWQHFFGICVIHPTVMIRREILEKLNFYRAEVVCAEDMDLWLRASAITEFSNVPEVLFKYRIWRNSTSKRLRQEYLDKAIELGAAFISKFLKEEIGNDAAGGLRGLPLPTMEQLVQTATVLERLYHTFVAQNSPSSEEIKEISWDAAKRMGRLALQASRFNRLESLFLLKRALQLNYRLLSPSAILTGLQRHRSMNFASN
jgi:glycosyltransferase involved in cell wall biosynthesis